MADRFSCARASRSRGEPIFGTASTVRRWILLEQPGPWGRDAVQESRLPGETAAALKERARQLGARVVLVRRHGRQDEELDAHTCYLAHTAAGNSWVEELEVARPGDLLDHDLTPLRSGASVGGRRLDHPLYLVCTNGKHDACCAEFGRPLAAALEAARPRRTWECSHIGGDRFAANLLCFPHGLYFGQVGPDDGAVVAAAYERHEISLAHYRGRSGYSFLVQAAEYFVRREEDLSAIGAIRFESADVEEPGSRFRVIFASRSGGRYVAVVGRRLEPRGQQLTCRAVQPLHPPRYELLELSRPDVA